VLPSDAAGEARVAVDLLPHSAGTPRFHYTSILHFGVLEWQTLPLRIFAAHVDKYFLVIQSALTVCLLTAILQQ
jgi:hypothetical protein